jgi:hypothetical protein
MGDKAKGDIMKTPAEDMHKERGSRRTNSEVAGPARDPVLDRGAIALLAYSYWEARGSQNDSPDEDWLRAEAELRKRLASTPTD